MNKIKIITILLASLSLFGCVGSDTSESGNSIGGVMRSDDSGKSFLSKSVIDEKKSLISTNVLSLEIDPSNGDTLYAGTQKNGLFISENNGEAWKSLNFSLTNIKEIVINSQNTNNLYISGMLNGRGSIYRTDDKGSTFNQIYIEPIDGTNITAMIINPKDPNIVYAGLSTGLLIRTLDGAKTFEDIISLERDNEQKIYKGNAYSLAVNPSVSGVILVGTDNGIFKSNDYGRSWEEVDTIASVLGIPIYALSINPHNTNQIVFAAAKAVYTKIGGSWAVTDTTSNRAVNVIKLNPVQDGIVYLGLISLGEN